MLNLNQKGTITLINTTNLTETTVQTLIEIARQQRKDPLVRRTIENILKSVPEKDTVAELKSIYNYVKQKMRYTRDIHNVEMVKTPVRHLTEISQASMTYGDCDDASLLLATLYESAGYKTRFVIVRTPGNKAPTYNHIYVKVFDPKNNQWISADATEKGKWFGWTPEALMKKEYDIR